MCTIHKRLIDLYYASLDEFISSINDDYESKNDIIEACKRIKYKLSYTAPEIINIVFCNYIELLIAKYLPRKNNEWAKKSWKILTDCSLNINNLKEEN